MASVLIVKKRRPINKKEARSIKEGILSTHNLEMPISAGKFEIGKTDNFDVLISKGTLSHLLIIIWCI